MFPPCICIAISMFLQKISCFREHRQYRNANITKTTRAKQQFFDLSFSHPIKIKWTGRNRAAKPVGTIGFGVFRLFEALILSLTHTHTYTHHLFVVPDVGLLTKCNTDPVSLRLWLHLNRYNFWIINFKLWWDREPCTRSYSEDWD